MIETLRNFFEWLSDIIFSGYHFFESLITGFINVFKSIPQIISFINNAIGYLPSALTIFAFLTLTISVAYLVIGRDTGG